MKKLLMKQRSDTPHWVGDGFPVRSVFSYRELGQQMSPFLLMDYAGPVEFPPTNTIRGVGSHPHRGFETVTIVYSGEVEHRDSAGGGGLIGPGDVQWMTAASGLVHEEKHAREFAKTGGLFEMVQLWVNLPAKDKMAKPRYQSLRNANIPKVQLANGAGFLRVIAGELGGFKGPAETFTAMNVWDARLKVGHQVELAVPEGQTVALFVLDGKLKFEDETFLESSEIGILDRKGQIVSLQVLEDSKVLVLTGEPLNEPIVGYGPFVMNSTKEIQQAFDDFNSGKMGEIAVTESPADSEKELETVDA